VFLGCHAPKFVQHFTIPIKDTFSGQNTHFEPSTMKIDLFVRAVREPKKVKNKQKGQHRFISCICGGGTPENGELKLGAFVELADIINHTIFYLFLMNSFQASGGQK
jgi:hypothetical protein